MTTLITLPHHTKTIGILSDSHGFVDRRILDSLGHVDVLFHAGDIMEKSVMDTLKQLNTNIYFVAGNNDTETVWPKKDIETVNAIPESIKFTIGNDKIGLIHGHQFGWSSPDHEQLRDHFKDCRVIVYGHTHKQTVDTTSTPWIINPGASGKIRTKGGVSCLILSLEANNQWDIHTIKYIDTQQAA